MGRYSVIPYDTSKYNFTEIIRELFQVDELSDIHTLTNEKYGTFLVGKDSSTTFHKQFYDKYHSGWEILQNTYDNFVEDYAVTYFNEDILYQKFPTFRVHLPNNVAVGAFHNDSEFHHPGGEINYILPLTNSEDTASVWVESEPKKEDFEAMDMKVGELIMFNGNKLTHGNKTNLTDKTRVSMDFRILPLSEYDDTAIEESITLKTKFKLGDYYNLLKIKSHG